MLFLLIGLVVVGLKVAGVAPVAAWSWWLVLLPFALAAAWWAFADASGLTKRREMRKIDEKAAARRARQLDAIQPGKKPGR